MAHRIAVVGLTHGVAQFPYRPLQRIRGVVVNFAAFLEAEELLDEDPHSLRISLQLVEDDVPALEQGLQGFDACEFVRLLARVSDDGYLVADLLAVLAELVEEQVLHESRLHFVPHRVVPDVIVGVVVPFDHRRDLRLVGIGFQHVVFALGRDADEHRRLEVGRRRRLERRVGVADDCAVFPHAQHLSEADVLLLENGSRIDGVVHVFALETPLAHDAAHFGDLPQRVVLRPGRKALSVERIDDGMVEMRIIRQGADDRRAADPVAYDGQASAPHRHRSEQGRQQPVHRFAHAPGIAHQLVVVDVVHRDIIGPQPALLDASRRLSASQRDEQIACGRRELAVRPYSRSPLIAEICIIEVVGLQLRLQVAQQAPGGFLAFRHQNHDQRLRVGLDLQPERLQERNMRGLGVPARPLEQAAGVFMVPHVNRGIDLEVRALGRRKVGKIGADKIPVILSRTGDAVLSLLLRSLRNLGR